jgi:hypothetical protein
MKLAGFPRKEAAMGRLLLKVLWLPTLVLSVSFCTPNPRMVSGTEPDYLLKLRADYLSSNPSGEYNEFIKRGEVVRGMDVLEVLAAWGHPKVRTKFTDLTEKWTYHEVDPDSKDSIDYTFTFHQGVLSDWALERHFAAGGSIGVPEGNERTSLTKGDYAAKQPAQSPKK